MTLELQAATLQYPDGDRTIAALDAVDFTTNAGEFVAVVGPSGSGKSSLLAVAGLLVHPDRGDVIVGGQNMTALDGAARARARRTEIGFIFQGTNLVPSLSARDQLLAVTHINGGRPRSDRVRAENLLARVGLAGRLDRRPHQLSGGERQRVGIARALMNDPSIILADEPTSALDVERGDEIVALLADIAHERGAAVVMVTHNHDQAGSADRIVGIRNGRVAAGDLVGHPA